ncbi:MAG TPA: SH3 domain-containing protein [Anaerolineae bacterium]|nr:SH3 domain-containing protein [Anaerolineae bacterium]
MTYTPPSQIRVTAQPHLNLRREPAIKTGNVVAQLADGSTWPVIGVARENFEAQSNVLWVQIEATNAATRQKVTGFCRSDFITPRPDPLPASQQVLPAEGLNLRSSPAFSPAINNKIVTMRGGSIIRVLGGAWENLDPRSGKWWFLVDYAGERGYAYARYLGDPTGARPGDDTTTSPGTGRPSPAWRFGVCLAGMGNSDANTWHEPTFQDAIKAARLESIKLAPLSDKEKMNRVYNWLRAQGIAFVMVRLTWKPNPMWADFQPAARMTAAINSFVETARDQIEFAYANGVRYFEVHNEPNITPNPTDPIGDGLGSAWLGPSEFAEWFSRVADQLRQIRRDIYLGFPGLAPRGSEFADFGGGLIKVNGQPLVWNTDKWLSSCKAVIDEKADWIGVHCYWQFDGGGLYGIENPDSGGMYWRRYKTRFPGKLLFITEFSNNGAQIPYADKGRQYGKYIGLLRREKSIGAAFAYSIYWASDPNREGWVTVTGEGKFRIIEIPGAMGLALAAQPATANPVVVNAPAVWV